MVKLLLIKKNFFLTKLKKIKNFNSKNFDIKADYYHVFLLYNQNLFFKNSKNLNSNGFNYFFIGKKNSLYFNKFVILPYKKIIILQSRDLVRFIELNDLLLTEFGLNYVYSFNSNNYFNLSEYFLKFKFLFIQLFKNFCLNWYKVYYKLRVILYFIKYNIIRNL